MFKKIILRLSTVLLVLTLSACSNSYFSHNYLMRGQVVSDTNNNIVVCVGYEDGAKVGQRLNVYRFFDSNNHGEGGDTYERRNVGVVEVTSIIDEHFAKVKLVEGKVTTADMVQLER